MSDAIIYFKMTTDDNLNLSIQKYSILEYFERPVGGPGKIGKRHTLTSTTGES